MPSISLSELWKEFEDEWNRYDPNWPLEREQSWDFRLSDIERTIELTPAKTAADITAKLRLVKHRVAQSLDAQPVEESNADLIDSVIDWVERQNDNAENEFADSYK